MTVSLVTASGTTQVLERGDYAVTAMVCNAGGLLEPTIQKLVSLTGNGSTANPLGVRLSSTAGNDLTIDGTGLFYNQTPIVATDSTSIDFTTSGVDGHNITAVVKLSATVGNVLTIDGTGLYYNGAPTISGPLSGRNNSLSNQPSGLYTPETRFTASNTCSNGGVGAAWAIREVTDVGNNDFVINGAPEHTSLFNTLSYVPGGLPVVLGGAGTTDLANSGTLTLNNTSACRNMIANTSIDAIAQFIAVGNKQLELNNQILVSINAGPYTSLSTNAIRINAQAGQTENTGNLVHRIVDIATIAPAGSRSFSVRHRTNVTLIAGGGSGTWTAAQAFISSVLTTV